MSAGGKISSTKLSFTLPISCQICLEKVKEPVTCPNQHVFCSLCMEVWLERNKQCPTCRVDITPQSPVRRIIGGSQSQNEEIRSPRTSKQLRRARMELLIRDYETEVAELQRESACLRHSNDELKSRLDEEEQKNSSSSAVSKSKCARCGNMKDIDSMLEMVKNLQEATRTFDQMKEENIQLKLTNAKLLKELDDLQRSNNSVKQELIMRSPAKFGRLTVATLESRIEAYEKEVAQLKKALEKSDAYTESLKDILSRCSCGADDSKPGKTVMLKEAESAEPSLKIPDDSLVYLSGHDYTMPCTDTRDATIPQAGMDVPDSSVATYTIQNLLSDDNLIKQSLAAVNFDENSLDENLFSSQQDTMKSPFTPSAKLSRLTLATTPKAPSFAKAGTDTIQLSDIQIQNVPFLVSQSCAPLESESQLVAKEQDAKAKNFTAQTMPTIESPDYKEKLEQIQGNLLHPIIATSSGSAAHEHVKSFSRRLTFDDTLQTVNIPDFSEWNIFEENTRSSCSENSYILTPNEDSIQSPDNHDSSRSYWDSRFSHSQSVLSCEETLPKLTTELIHGSLNPILSSGQFQREERKTLNQSQTRELRREASLSVVEAGGSRITTTKLSDSDRDVFTRPSSAPSRTFLLSGSRFSALRPLDPQHCMVQLSEFQPVKCKSPSPLTVGNLSAIPGRSSITPKKEAIRCVVDGRASSPMLRLVSPDEVIGGNWKPAAIHSRANSAEFSSQTPGSHKGKETMSRVAILKRNSTGKLSSFSNLDVARSSPVLGASQGEDAATSSRKNSRKQCLSDPNTKRVGEHSMEFVSPIKSPKMERNWK